MMNTPFLTDHTRSMMLDRSNPGIKSTRVQKRTGSELKFGNDTGPVNRKEPILGSTGSLLTFQNDKKQRLGGSTNPLSSKNSKQANFLKFLNTEKNTQNSNHSTIEHAANSGATTDIK